MNQDFPLVGDWPDCPKSVVGIIAQDKLGRVLTQYRDDFPHVIEGGRWGLFGGHVEPGETLIETVVRELEEEIGVALPASDFEPLLRFVPTESLRAYHYIFRVKPALEPSQITLQEGAGFAFVAPHQFSDLDMIEANRITLSFLKRQNELDV